MKIISYIKEHGLEKAIEDFSLIKKDYGHKFLLKYHQIDSPLSKIEVQECRGLILSNDLEIISYPFFKFFNLGEPNAVSIDWGTARVLDKEDGSMIQVYFDKYLDDWCVGTTGTAHAEGPVGTIPNMDFRTLFDKTLLKYFNYTYEFYDKLTKGYTYMFELCTPYNIVVAPHSTSKIVLLGIRNTFSLEEVDFSRLQTIADKIGVDVVKSYDLNSIEDIKSTFENMPFSEEGYVVMDADFNRIKIKNPSYVAMHHLKSKMCAYNIMEIIKKNEIDEFIAVFEDRREEIYGLKEKFDVLNDKLSVLLSELMVYIPSDKTNKAEVKEYALKVFDFCKEHKLEQFTGFFFAYSNGKVKSVEEYLMEADNRKLYNFLNGDK